MKRFRLTEDLSTRFDKVYEHEAWEADRFDWIEAIKSIMATPLDPQRGATVEEMRKSIRVLDALEGKKVGDILELEDADHDHLVQKVDSFRWARVDRRFVRFITTIKDAGEDVVDETPAEATSRSNGATSPAAGIPA